MGVPLVTMPGRSRGSRQSHAILTVIGHGDWSAADPDAYVATATALAKDEELRQTLRRQLRDDMRSSPLCDPRRLAAALESTYRILWDERYPPPG